MAHHPEMPRTPEGLRKGGATRPANSTVWGTDAFRAPETVKNVPAGEASYTVIGSHAANAREAVAARSERRESEGL
jgi:hypothetical protein